MPKVSVEFCCTPNLAPRLVLPTFICWELSTRATKVPPVAPVVPSTLIAYDDVSLVVPVVITGVTYDNVVSDVLGNTHLFFPLSLFVIPYQSLYWYLPILNPKKSFYVVDLNICT